MTRAVAFVFALLLTTVLCLYGGARIASHEGVVEQAAQRTDCTLPETEAPNPFAQRPRASIARLPQPQAELPLLGLVGLGSLVAGLIMRR